MVLVLKKGASKKEIMELEKKLAVTSNAGFDAHRFNGAAKIKGDALEIQKQLRDEWERNIG